MGDIGTLRLKRAAIACLAIPIVVLAAFAIGEVATGDISGLQHVGQGLPLVALAWLAWKWPLIAGTLFVAAERRDRMIDGRTGSSL